MLVFCGFQFGFAFVLAFYSFYICDTICVYLPNKWTGASSILAFCPGDCNTAFCNIYNSRCSWYRWKCARIRRTMQIYTSTFFHLDTQIKEKKKTFPVSLIEQKDNYHKS